MRKRIVSDKVIERLKTSNLVFTTQELDRASKNISIVAERHGVSESDVRSEIDEAIKSLCSSQHSGVQEMGKTFCFDGAEPSPEEFILWFRNLFILAMHEYTSEGLTEKRPTKITEK